MARAAEAEHCSCMQCNLVTFGAMQEIEVHKDTGYCTYKGTVPQV